MRWLIVAIIGVVVGVIGVILIAPVLRDMLIDSLIRTLPPEVMYPPAPQMPAVVDTSVEELLGRYEVFLKEKAPDIYASLQPGLTEAQLNSIESEQSLKLPADLRALYRWRNGTAIRSGKHVFPDHEFVSLHDAVANRDHLLNEIKKQTPAKQKQWQKAAGFRQAWLDVIVDAAGDGYFFDPKRSEQEGSFFFCFAEDISYDFYPAFRNYLAAIDEGVQAGVFVSGEYGVETADFERAHSIYKKYSASPPR